MRNRVRQKSLITVLLVFFLSFSLFAGGNGESTGEQPDSFSPSEMAAPGMGMPPEGNPPGPPPTGGAELPVCRPGALRECPWGHPI